MTSRISSRPGRRDAGEPEEGDAAAELVADIARQHRAERRADAGRGADDALREIEMPAAEGDVGDDQRDHHREHRRGDAVEDLHRDQQDRDRVTVANSTPRIASAAKPISSSGRRPHCCALRPTVGDISATIACGTMMQAAISTGAHWLDRVVTTPAMIGSIAALASCSSSTLPAKISSGRCRIRLKTLVAFAIRRLARHRAVRLRDVDLALADARQRDQGRDREQEGDEEHRAAGE